MMGDQVVQRPWGRDVFVIDLRSVFAGHYVATPHQDGSPGYHLIPASEHQVADYRDRLLQVLGRPVLGRRR